MTSAGPRTGFHVLHKTDEYLNIRRCKSIVVSVKTVQICSMIDGQEDEVEPKKQQLKTGQFDEVNSLTHQLF